MQARTEDGRFEARGIARLCRAMVILTVALHVALPGEATAETGGESASFDRPGPYVGVGGSYQYNVFSGRIEDLLEDEADDALPGANASFDLDDSGGFNALLGYRLASWFALEFQYEWVDEYDIDGSTNTPVRASGTLYSIEGHTLTVNTKWVIPSWRIQPYFLLGGGVAISRVDNGNLAAALNALGGDIDDGTHAKPAARTGLGLDLYLTENVVINAQASAVLTTLKEPDLDDIDDLNYMTFAAGLQYRF